MKALTKHNAAASTQKAAPRALTGNDLISSLLTGTLPHFVDSEMQFPVDVDVSESKNAFHIQANVPGVDPEKINVEVEGNTLSLSGETEKEDVQEEKNFYRMERSSGSFFRSFELPNTANFEKVQCSAKNGVLSIDIPKKEESKGRKISVSVKK